MDERKEKRRQDMNGWKEGRRGRQQGRGGEVGVKQSERGGMGIMGWEDEGEQLLKIGKIKVIRGEQEVWWCILCSPPPCSLVHLIPLL